MGDENKTISIPASLYKRVEDKIKGADNKSVSDFVAKVLREFLSREEGSGVAFSKEDEEKVKERLKALGYID